MRSTIRITSKNRKWWILIAMTSTISMMFLDQTILGVTLPTIHQSLGISSLALQWIVNAYLLTLATLVLGVGRICDIYGARKIYFIGTLVFAVASALCGLSMNATWFIASRVLQGVGGAMLYPSTTAILFGAFPIHERGRAMGIFVSIGAIFMSTGPLIGGIFTEFLSWRYVFWINLPIAIIGVFLTLLSVPKQKRQSNQCLYPMSYLLFGGGVAVLIFALMNGGKWGWDSSLILTLFFFSLILFILFFLRNNKLKNPLIDISLFKKKIFSGGVISTSCNQFILMITIFWAMYFQTTLDYSPVEAGLLSLFTNIPVLLSAPLAGTWLDKKGPKPPVVTGFCLILFALLWFAYFAKYPDILHLFPSLFFFGWGLPLVFTPASTATIAQAPIEKRGLAIGTNLTIRQFGGTLGLALFSSVFLQIRLFKLTHLLQANNIKGIKAKDLDGLLAKAPDALEALRSVSRGKQHLVIESVLEATTNAFSMINLLGVLIALTGLIAAAILFKKTVLPKARKS